MFAAKGFQQKPQAAIVAVTSKFNAATSAIIALSKPAGTVAGNLMIAVLGSEGNATYTGGQAGWTKVTAVAGNPNLALFWKAATSADTATSAYTFSMADVEKACGALITIQNAAFDVAGSVTAITSNTAVAAEILPTRANSLLFGVWMSEGINHTATTPSGMAAVASFSNDQACSLSIFSQLVAATSTSSRQATMAGSSLNAMLFSVK